MLWHLLHQIIQVVERISAISPGHFDQREHCYHSFRSLYGETKQTVLAVKRHRFHTAFRNPVVNRNASVCQEPSQIYLLVQWDTWGQAPFDSFSLSLISSTPIAPLCYTCMSPEAITMISFGILNRLKYIANS